jgi:hypothetical protein
MNKKLTLFLLVCLALFNFSCEDPSSIGGDLLNDKRLDVVETSEFDLEGQTLPGKPVVTLIQGLSAYSSFPVGSYEDIYFGLVKSEVFSKILFNNTALLPTSMHQGKFDSVVVVMSYDTLSTYGDLNEEHTITIKEVEQLPVVKDSVFSNTPIISQNVGFLGMKTFVPRPKDSVTIKDYINDSIVLRLPAQIRVPLNKEWFANKFAGIKTIETNTALQSLLKGISISSNSKKSLLGLNFGTVADDASRGVNGIYVYYRDSSDVRRTYRFLFSPYKYTNFESIPSSSLAKKLNSVKEGENLLFVQGLDGVNAEIAINDIDKLRGKIISYASLELTVADLEGYREDLYPFVPQLSVVYDTPSGPVLIRDISDLLISGLALNLGFGGDLVAKPGTKGLYKLNITKLVKGMVLGNIPNKFRILVNNSNQRPHRTPFYGTKHPVYPVKLVVSYTNPPN